MKQSRLESILEQMMSVGSGFLLSLCVWKFMVVPLMEHGHIYYNDSLAITMIFTLISVIRGYFWRRCFNNQIPYILATKLRKFIC